LLKKALIIFTILTIFLLAFSAVSAADSDAAVSSDDSLLSADDTTAESEKIEVKLTADQVYGIYGIKDNELTAQVSDNEGNKVKVGSVVFVDVFGKNYTVDVNDGSASANVYVGDTGEFNIACLYIGTDGYSDANTTLPLIVPVTNTSCTNLVATRYDDTVYFTGNVKSDFSPYSEDNPVQEVTRGIVTAYVDGEKLGTCDLDVNGNFVYIWETSRNLIGETINFTGVYSDSGKHYNPTTFSKIFTFDPPKDTEIVAQVSDVNDHRKLVTGDVIDEDGNNVIGGTITVNGKYTVPVDTHGKFRFYLTDETPKKATYELGVIDWGSKADIRVNTPLMNAIDHTELVDQLIDLCTQGSPYIKFGNGNGETLVMVVGTHGGELASQVAGFKLINLLADYGDEIEGTIYIFPTIFPEATANNTRIYNGTNLNTVAAENGTISNSIVKFAKSVNAIGLGDFHNTRHGDDDVGVTCIFCSESPTPESEVLGEYIVAETGYRLKSYPVAGNPYAGAIEDYANLEFYIPSVTCEALSNHRAVEYGTPEMSFNEMCAFLRYFGYEVYDMIEIPVDFTEDVVLTFTSPYNYNPSSLVLKLNSTEPAHNLDTNKIAHASEETLPAAGNPIAVALLALLALGVGGLKRRL
jgi:predicted deacylase